ncbi:MAG TPA: YkgJ family cysteine cluster protein [Nitrospirota bacterium]|nr:YkgJ family cysteine cluster protein [Nitrospirota bacterium]
MKYNTHKSPDKRFYKDGLRFECRGDGKCCISRGKYGYVYVSFNDRRRMARFFKMSLESFTKKYVVREEGWFQLKYEGKDCPFLHKNRCSIYEARPWQCRTWPFWPENMNAAVWKKEVADYCPGVGKGRLFTAAEIDDILAKKRDVAGILVCETKICKSEMPDDLLKK